ncbi:SVAGG family GlyGly-CTERM protein [Vibrio vulnificus]
MKEFNCKAVALSALMMLSSAVNAAPTNVVHSDVIDTVFMVDQEVVDKFGREKVDLVIAKAIGLSNQTLDLAGLPYYREVKNVVTVPANGEVSSATRGFQGAYGGNKRTCDHLTAEHDFIDNVVWLVPESGSSIIGNARSCYKGDNVDNGIGKYVSVVAMELVGRPYSADVSEVIAHELGHFDGMSHRYADEHLAATGVTTLMCSNIKDGLGDLLLTNGDIMSMQDAAMNNDTWHNLFSWSAPDGPEPTGTVTLEFNESEDVQQFELLLRLNAVHMEDVSVEFYTQADDAIVNEDYVEKVERVTFYAGETEKRKALEIKANEHRTQERQFMVGVRYGDGVNAAQSLPITLDAVPTAPVLPDTGVPNSGGGGSGGSIGWLSLWLLYNVRRFRK